MNGDGDEEGEGVRKEQSEQGVRGCGYEEYGNEIFGFGYHDLFVV